MKLIRQIPKFTSNVLSRKFGKYRNIKEGNKSTINISVYVLPVFYACTNIAISYT